MHKLIQLSLILSSSLCLQAGTLQDDIRETLNTNPIIQNQLKDFRIKQQNLNIVKSEYYPSVDLRASFAYNRAGDIKDSSGHDYNYNVIESDYRNYETSLTITQNLFSGFSTKYGIKFENAQILASSYKYIEVSNDISFKMTTVYLEVLKFHELILTAQENVNINKAIYSKVNNLFQSGLTTDSEVKKIQSILALANSNLIVAKSNARDAMYRYRKVLGRMPLISEMTKPSFSMKMPKTIEDAALYAIENNPSLLVSKYNIEAMEALHNKTKQGYYPTIDLEVSQVYNDHDEIGNGFNQADDRFKARIVLNYNIFRGGADRSNIQKHVSSVSKEIDLQRELKRQVVEGLDLAWNSYHMLKAQLIDLNKYSSYAKTTLELYKEEYDLGRRSLLDLLSAQNDLINSRSQIVTAQYDMLTSKYRILDAMGLLVVTVNGTVEEFTSKVNLNSDKKDVQILDTITKVLDVDKDELVYIKDLCDNSKDISNVEYHGCVKDITDQLNTEVSEPIIPKTLDSDNDGILNDNDKCNSTPLEYKVNNNGCALFVSFEINFDKNKYDLSIDLEDKIDELTNYLINKDTVNIIITGHSSKTKISSAWYNSKLSVKRANQIKQELVNRGISAARIKTTGKGFLEPIADNSTQEGRVKNRRVEIAFIRE